METGEFIAVLKLDEKIEKFNFLEHEETNFLGMNELDIESSEEIVPLIFILNFSFKLRKIQKSL